MRCATPRRSFTGEKRGGPVEPHPPTLVFIHHKGELNSFRDSRISALGGDRGVDGWDRDRVSCGHSSEPRPGAVNGPADEGTTPESGAKELREGCAVGQDEGTEDTHQDAYGNEVGEDEIRDGS